MGLPEAMHPKDVKELYETELPKALVLTPPKKVELVHRVGLQQSQEGSAKGHPQKMIITVF